MYRKEAQHKYVISSIIITQGKKLINGKILGGHLTRKLFNL